MPIQVLPNHVRMPAMALRILGRPTKDFRKERGDMLWMLVAHVREDRRQNGVVPHPLIEARRQAVQHIDTADPFVERWDGRIHGSSPIWERMSRAISGAR